MRPLDALRALLGRAHPERRRALAKRRLAAIAQRHGCTRTAARAIARDYVDGAGGVAERRDAAAE